MAVGLGFGVLGFGFRSYMGLRFTGFIGFGISSLRFRVSSLQFLRTPKIPSGWHGQLDELVYCDLPLRLCLQDLGFLTNAFPDLARPIILYRSLAASVLRTMWPLSMVEDLVSGCLGFSLKVSHCDDLFLARPPKVQGGVQTDPQHCTFQRCAQGPQNVQTT